VRSQIPNMYCKILFTAGRGHCDNDSSEDLTPHIPVTRSGRLARKKRPPLESPRVNKAWKKLIPNFQLYSRVVWLVTNFKLDVPVVVSESSGSQLTARCTGCFPQLATFHFQKLRPLRSSDDAYRKWKAVDAGVVMCPARPEAPGQARPCQSRPGQARPCSTAWTGFWPGSSLVRPEPSPQALASVIYFFRRDNQNNLPEIKNLPSCKRSVRFFSCDHRVLHITTKMATRIEGNPKATMQRKVLGS